MVLYAAKAEDIIVGKKDNIVGKKLLAKNCT
jgi:hypothetical protein